MHHSNKTNFFNFKSFNYVLSDVYTFTLIIIFTIFMCLLLVCACTTTDTSSARRYLCCSCASKQSSNVLHRPIRGIIITNMETETREHYPNQRMLDFYGQHYLELNRTRHESDYRNQLNSSAPPPNYNTIH